MLDDSSFEFRVKFENATTGGASMRVREKLDLLRLLYRGCAVVLEIQENIYVGDNFSSDRRLVSTNISIESSATAE